MSYSAGGGIGGGSSFAKRIPTRDSGLQPLTHALLVSPATARASQLGAGAGGGGGGSERDRRAVSNASEDDQVNLSNSSSFSSQHSDGDHGWSTAGETVAAAATAAAPRVAHAYSSSNALMAAPTAANGRACGVAGPPALPPPFPVIAWLRCGNHLFSLGSLGSILMNFASVLGTDNSTASLSTAMFLAISIMFVASALCYDIDVASFPAEWTRRRFYHPTKRRGALEEPQEEQFMTDTNTAAATVGGAAGAGARTAGGTIDHSVAGTTINGSSNHADAAAAFSKRPAFAPVYSSRDIAAADYDAANFDPDTNDGSSAEEGVSKPSEKLRGYGQGGMMHAASAGRNFGGMRNEPDQSLAPASPQSPQKRLIGSADSSESDATTAGAEANRSGWWPLRAESYCELLNLLGALVSLAACAMPYMIPSMDPATGVNLNSVPLSIALVDLSSQIVWLLSALGGAWVWHRDRMQVAREKFLRGQRGMARATAEADQARGEQMIDEASIPTRKSNRNGLHVDTASASSSSTPPAFDPRIVKCSWLSLNSLGWWVCVCNIVGCLLYVSASLYGLNTSVVVLKQTKVKMYRDPSNDPPAVAAVAMAAGMAEGAWAYLYSGASYARYQLLHGSFGLGLPSSPPSPSPPHRPPKLVPQWSISPQFVQTRVHQQRVLNLAGDCVFLLCALLCELEYAYETYREVGAKANSASSAAAAARRKCSSAGGGDASAAGGGLSAKSKSPSAVRRMPPSVAHPRSSTAGPSSLHAHLMADAADHGGGRWNGVSGSEGGTFDTPYDSADSSMSNSYRFTTAWVGPSSVASHVGTMPGSARQHWRKPSDVAAAPSFDRTASYSSRAPVHHS